MATVLNMIYKTCLINKSRCVFRGKKRLTHTGIRNLGNFGVWRTLRQFKALPSVTLSYRISVL